MKSSPALSYSIRRLALFLGTLALATALLRGVSFVVVLLVSTVVSAGLSYLLLARDREAMARSIAGRVGALNERLDAGAKAEDAALDAAERPLGESGESSR